MYTFVKLLHQLSTWMHGTAHNGPSAAPDKWRLRIPRKSCQKAESCCSIFLGFNLLMLNFGSSPLRSAIISDQLSHVRLQGFQFFPIAAVLSQQFSFAPDLDALRNRGADRCQGLRIGGILWHIGAVHMVSRGMRIQVGLEPGKSHTHLKKHSEDACSFNAYRVWHEYTFVSVHMCVEISKTSMEVTGSPNDGPPFP